MNGGRGRSGVISAVRINQSNEIESKMQNERQEVHCDEISRSAAQPTEVLQ